MSMAVENMAGRVRYPGDEARHPWLARLLDAYHAADAVLRGALERETARRGGGLACGPGCCNCCMDQQLPVSEFEVQGIWWYVSEVLEGGLRAELLRRLLGHGPVGECAFLLAGRCAVYPVRPFVCRQYHVFRRPCGPGENVYETRSRDAFRPAVDSPRDLIWQIIPLYGVAEENVDWLAESGYVSRKGKHPHTLALDTIVMHLKTAAPRRKARHA
ncbi:MAG: YkgJ family cysteine cluster protein [Humidesulfovibrio sp.]|nr:YkgJ family cysteine cluster protein [Humidesulfovibrio sp.]